MEAVAKKRYVRISPLKARRVLQLIKGKRAEDALMMLKFMPSKGARIIREILQAAVANAENNFELNVDKLVVAKAYADKGPYLKRIRAVSMGRAHRINKPTSHITIVVEEKEED